MKTSSLIKYTVIGACLPLFVGCVERQVVYRDRPAPPPPAYVEPAPPPPMVVEAEPPPPPPVQVEVMSPPPGPMAVWYWAPGCWEWNGRWEWTRGYWIRRPHPGAVWVGAHWDVRGGRKVWARGHWRE